MRVKVQYFGVLQDFFGQESEWIGVADGTSLADLYEVLRQETPKFAEFQHSIALAVNYEYSGPEVILKDGDEVALIPPVSGGASDEHDKLVASPAAQRAALVR